MRDGWVRTGDLFTRDDDGFFYYKGRVDDVVKIGSLKVSPSEVEQFLMLHPAVRECCVVGTKTKNDLLALTAYVHLDSDGDAGIETVILLKKFLAGSLPPHKVPSRIVFVDSLPRTPTGKLDRKAFT
jgi:acyl-coenzyme A synthetase/AMP-(fatty) acid ligase